MQFSQYDHIRAHTSPPPPFCFITQQLIYYSAPLVFPPTLSSLLGKSFPIFFSFVVPTKPPNPTIENLPRIDLPLSLRFRHPLLLLFLNLATISPVHHPHPGSKRKVHCWLHCIWAVGILEESETFFILATHSLCQGHRCQSPTLSKRPPRSHASSNSNAYGFLSSPTILYNNW